MSERDNSSLPDALGDAARPLPVRAVADPMTSGADLAQIAQAQPGLWPQVATHPNAYPDLLAWLAANGDGAVKQIVADRFRHVNPPKQQQTSARWLVIVVVIAMVIVGAGAVIWAVMAHRGASPTSNPPDSTPLAACASDAVPRTDFVLRTDAGDVGATVDVITSRVVAAALSATVRQASGTDIDVTVCQSLDSTSISNVTQLLATPGNLSFRRVYEVAQSSAPATPSDSASSPRRIAPALPTAPPTQRPSTPGTNPSASFDDLLNWQQSTQDTTDFANWNCGDPFPDVWDQPLFACDANYQKYLLGPVIVQGQRISGAQSGIPQGGVAYQVTLSFDATGTDEFAQATTKLVNQTSPMNQFAIVLDGAVVSAPRVDQAITGGQAQLTGTFTQQQAQILAATLSVAPLPSEVNVVSVNQVH